MDVLILNVLILQFQLYIRDVISSIINLVNQI